MIQAIQIIVCVFGLTVFAAGLSAWLNAEDESWKNKCYLAGSIFGVVLFLSMLFGSNI